MVVQTQISRIAQRRPERQLRRHPRPCLDDRRVYEALNEGRSINSGDTSSNAGGYCTPHMRSTKAGASTPATRKCVRALCAQRRPEHQLRRHATRTSSASPSTLNEGRSINSGDTFPVRALSGPLCGLRRHATRFVTLARSTKAGASTPATPGPGHVLRSPVVRRALNEGRSINSGDTRASSGIRSTFYYRQWTLNEGRSINSGDT